MDGAFGGLVIGEVFGEGFDGGRGGIETDVSFERGEMEEVAVECECGDLIFDGFLSGGSGGPDGGANFLEEFLNIGRELGDVVVDGGGWGGFQILVR